MNKTHIRTYSINANGDVQVFSYQTKDRVDLSKHYEDESRPPRSELKPESYVDVFRFDDGGLAWSGSPNGYDMRSALSYKLLLSLLLEDIDSADGTARSF